MFKILCIILTSILFIPTAVFSENYTVSTTNQTITITIQSPNVTVKPNNTIIVETAQLEKLLESITAKNEPKWNQGDIIVSSSTIFAFFGFGSFLVIRFQSKQKIEELLDSAKVILACIGGIQIFHLIVIFTTILLDFNPSFYAGTLIITGFLLVMSLIHVGKITDIENKNRSDTSDEVITNFRNELVKKGIILEDLEKQVSGLRRENKRIKNEFGEG